MSEKQPTGKGRPYPETDSAPREHYDLWSQEQYFERLKDPRPLSVLEYLSTDFSVVLFRPYFMLVSEKNHMKGHKNQ
jgi:hypothetical protein